MGTDRLPYGEQPCECGRGRILIDRCEPSFGWFDPSQVWFEGTIECPACSATYRLEQQDTALVLVRRVDVEERERKRTDAAEESRRFMARSDVVSVLRRFGEKLDSFRSKAAIYRYLQSLGFHVQSQSAFSSKWESGVAWASGWRNDYEVERAIEGLGESQPQLLEEIVRLRELKPEGKLTVVRELARVGEPMDRTDRMSHTKRPDGIIIALDGPAGSGKSSTAKAVAARLGYRHLDSGAFYRAITWAALQAGVNPEGWAQLTHDELDRMDVHGRPNETGYTMTVRGMDVSAQIRTPEVNAHVSQMAAVPAVRAWLMDALRESGARGGLVADGRDIGTVVFPDAELKAYLIADAEERARRRLREMGATDLTDDDVRSEAARLQGRDAIDSGRETAPLRQADDAVVVDTTALTFSQQVDRIVALACERGGVDPGEEMP